MKSNYDILGNHIRLIDTRNRESITDRVLGINIDKFFMPSVANVIGTDLSKYKLITKGKFACNPMHVGRDERLPVALYDEEKPAIVSPAYFMFEVIDNSILNEDYLMMWFRRPEFDRICWLHTDGSVRGGITWDDICRLELPIPPIENQLEIVNSYKTITERIALKQKINDNLLATTQAIYKSWFVDFEPFGGVQPSEMQFIPLQELCKVVTKGTTPTTLGKSFTNSGINFIKAESIHDNHSIDSSKFAFIDEETNALLKRSIIKANDIVFTIAGTLGRFAMIDNSMLPANTNQAVAIIRPDETKVTPAYLYSFFIGNWHNEYYSKRIQQAVQANLSLTTIKSLPIAVLNDTTMSNYDKLVSPLFALMKNNEEENRRLSKLRDTLLPKLMSGELDVSDIDF